MQKRFVGIVSLIALLVLVSKPALASVDAPDEVSQNSQAIIRLGTAVEKGKVVQGFGVLHYNKSYARAGGGGKRPSDPTASCYAFTDGAKWKVTESYGVGAGIDPLKVARSLEAWDSQVAYNIFGDQDSAMVVDGVDNFAPDGKNEIVFGSVQSAGAIALAIVWGVFGGDVAQREIVEFDLVFDNVDYTWGDAATNPQVMDFENIATHELGHAAGMLDLYTTVCGEQTMYGYSGAGEIKKRTLELGDITGIRKLYK